MQDTAEAIDYQRQIEEALAGKLTEEDEEDVLAELEQLEKDVRSVLYFIFSKYITRDLKKVFLRFPKKNFPIQIKKKLRVCMDIISLDRETRTDSKLVEPAKAKATKSKPKEAVLA